MYIHTSLCPIMLEGAKLLAASMSAIEWYKSRAHIVLLSEVIQILSKVKCPYRAPV